MTKFFREEDGMETLEWIVILGVVSVALVAVAAVSGAFKSTASAAKNKTAGSLSKIQQDINGM